MKNFTQKFTGILALVFAMSFTVNSQEIGDVYEGGYIFQINEDGTGLVADLQDLGEMTWYDAIDAAASAFSQGYDNWYLPSMEELELMYNTIGNGADNAGGFENLDGESDNYYWSSSVTDDCCAWVVSFNVTSAPHATYEGWYHYHKDYTFRFRVIRSVTFGEEGDGDDIVQGCLDPSSPNYNADANTDDGSCVAVVNGCIDDAYIEFNAFANTDDSSCTLSVFLELPLGWSMFGYTCLDSVDAMEGLSSISDKIDIVKDEWGLTYLPSWDFNGMGSLHFSEGYQIKMIEEVTDFQFCEAIAGGAYQEELDAAFDEGAASVTPEDGIGQADVDAAYSEGAASVTPEDGISQADVDAAFAEGVASANILTSLSQENIYGAVDAWLVNPALTEATYGPISDWDVSSVTNMSGMFRVNDMYGSDNYNECLNSDISNWDVSNVTNMNSMFQGCSYFGDISNWDVSNVTDMSYMFDHATSFNGDLSSWDVSSVTNMYGMFLYASSFNADLSSWDVSNVTDMGYMFSEATSFNGDLSSWNVSNVTNMYVMFYYAPSFNGDLSSWDVSSVTDMSYMFEGASSFNADLSSWDVSNVTDMSNMFYNPFLSLSEENQCAIQYSFSTNPNWTYDWCLDECGVPNGDNSCLDECGVPNGDNSTCLDCAGVVNGTSEDLGCGCGNPAAQAGYTCNGNEVYHIGDQHAGGIVFQMNEDGTGLVADLQDLVDMDWNDAMDAAANATSQGYDDWYLPSIEELELMYNTIGNGGPEGNIGGFSSYYYWSSSEYDSNGAWYVLFSYGNTNYLSKYNPTGRVRVIRAF
jgi:surface protein